MANSLQASTQKQKKKLPKLFDFDNESFESIREFTSGVAGSVKHDLAEEGAKDLYKQLLGKYEETSHGAQRMAGDLEEGQEFDLSSHGESEQQTTVRRDIDPGLEQYNYYREIARSSEHSQKRESYQMDRQVEEILIEIKQLIDTSKEIETEFKFLAVEQTPVEVGKYHIHFFDWVLTTIRSARMKVEDSGAWLSAMSSKKGKRNYWSMFKKHGTSFGMSNERSVSTQTG